MLYGISPVYQALYHQKRNIKRLLVKEGKPSPKLKEIVQLARKRKITIEECSVHKLGNLAKTKMHQGVILECDELETLDLEDFLANEPEKQSVILALDQVEDPQNLGGLIRSAAFLGAAAILTLKDKSSPLTATVSKASAGAMEYFPIIQVNNLSEALQRLKKEFYLVIGSALDEGTVNYKEQPAADRLVLVVGNEGSGLRTLTKKRCDALVKIPGRPDTESLNVNVAGSILLNHYIEDF